MKIKNYLPILIPGIAFSAFAVTFPENYHAVESSLAKGKWVKIKVDSTGVYKVSHERLRQLGFEKPESVAFFGRGLTPMPNQFMTTDDEVVVDADVRQIPTVNIGDAVYFFGVGPSWLTYVDSTKNVSSHFERLNKNVYNRHGYYLITDSRTPLSMDSVAKPADTYIEKTNKGISYLLNDKNNHHGFYDSSQTYLDTYFGATKLLWNLTPAYAVSRGSAVVEAAVYADDTAGPTSSSDGNLLWFKAYTAESSTKLPQSDAGAWNNLVPNLLSTTLNGTRLDISTWVTGPRTVGKVALDYWLLSYQSQLDQAIIASHPVVADMSENEWTRVALPSTASGSMALDVSDPGNPQIINIDGTETGAVMTLVREKGQPAPRPILVDTKTIAEAEIVGEQPQSNLHAQAAKGADFLIITVPAFRAEAEALARLHRDYDGMTCIVANVGDIYNEYNSGQPSIMAYKSLVKQIYKANAGRHLDVLLFGPLKGDMLGVVGDIDVNADECIIAYQSDIFPQKGDSHNINEFIGMMDDNITVRPEYAPIQVGVGILPCLSHEEAQRIVSKIERYITEPHYELATNKMLGMGGSGDNQSHGKQASELQQYVRGYYEDGVIYTPHLSEAFQKNGQMDRFVDNFNSGQTVITYMGHGGAGGFDHVPLMTSGYVHALKNDILPFMCFGMCDATGPDRGVTGLADKIVLRHDDGLIGCLASTRTAYSNQNASMLRLFLQNLAPKLKSSPEASYPEEQLRPKTVGEVYASARTSLRTLHENTFALICDPALRLATPVGRIKMREEVSPIISIGQPTKLSGEVRSNADNLMSNFNGNCVLRVMMPEETLLCPSLVSGGTPTDKQRATIRYAHRVEATFYGRVKNGIWEVTLDPVESQIIYDTSTLTLQLSAYDPTLRVGASGMLNASFQKVSDGNARLDDNAPVIDRLEYDAESDKLVFEVSDDRGLKMADDSFTKGMSIVIDGKSYPAQYHRYDISKGDRHTLKGTIEVDNLGVGDHSAELYVADNAGNSVTQTLTFSRGNGQPDRNLQVSATVSNTDLTFEVDTFTKGRLMIADHTGNIVTHREIEGTTAYFDLCDSRGTRLPQGVYRAWVISDGQDNGFSHSVDFAILEPLVGQ